MATGIDYLIVGNIREDRWGRIDDPSSLREFYRRVSSHPEFKPKLCVYMEKPVVGHSLELPDFGIQ